jgi:hypothetical protein
MPALVGAVIVSLCCATVMMMLGIALMHRSGDPARSTRCTCTPANASTPQVDCPSPAITTAEGRRRAACYMPEGYLSAALQSRTWVLAGDSFAAAASDRTTVPWAQLLQARAEAAFGAAPALINVASQGGTLASQLAAMLAAAEVRAAIAARSGVLLFVSYGIELLETGGIELDQLSDELELLANRSAALGLRVLLINRPDPIAGGLRVLPSLMMCDEQLRYLNYPTTMTHLMHSAAYLNGATLAVNLSLRYNLALVQPDVLFSDKSLALCKAGDDPFAASFFASCSDYNRNGHARFSAALWSCMDKGALPP